MKKELTKAEEQVMQYLWDMEKGFLKDIVEKYPEPRPAYTTVSTVIRVLVKKEFIGFKTYGKVNEYYLSGSPAGFASFFTNAKLSLDELEEIREMIDDRIRKIKSNK
jgi:predicted transcriptional regulator